MEANPANTPNPVPYQTAFWTLVPLAITTMTQPSGRVLTTPSHHRTYLRSSPIFCSLDAISFLLKLILSPVLLQISWSEGVADVIRQRYSDVRGDDEMLEGIQGLEKMAMLRWVFFVFGTLGPAAKLCAMEGVPWTKAWGVMFLGSFVVFEGMVFVRGFFEGSRERNEDASGAAMVDERMKGLIKIMENILFWVAVLAHSGLLIWAVLDLWELRVLASSDQEFGAVVHLLAGCMIAHYLFIIMAIPLGIFLILFNEFRVLIWGRARNAVRRPRSKESRLQGVRPYRPCKIRHSARTLQHHCNLVGGRLNGDGL